MVIPVELYEALHKKKKITLEMHLAEDSDQPVHLFSLISLLGFLWIAMIHRIIRMTEKTDQTVWRGQVVCAIDFGSQGFGFLIFSTTVWHFIAQSFSLSPFHCLSMT